MAFMSSRFGPATIGTVYELRRTEEKLATANNQLTFLMTCRDQRLTLKGLRIRMPIESEQAQRIKKRTECAIVRERIRYTERKRAVLFLLSEKLRDDIRTKMNQKEFLETTKMIERLKTKTDRETKARHETKLQNLMNEQTKRTIRQED